MEKIISLKDKQKDELIEIDIEVGRYLCEMSNGKKYYIDIKDQIRHCWSEHNEIIVCDTSSSPINIYNEGNILVVPFKGDAVKSEFDGKTWIHAKQIVSQQFIQKFVGKVFIKVTRKASWFNHCDWEIVK